MSRDPSNQREPAHTLPEETVSGESGGPEAPGSMAGHVGRGMAWLIFNIGVSKLMVLGSQLALGAILSKSEFGVYAISLGITSIVTVFKDGGIRELLVQRQHEYDKLVGSVFWLAFTVNVIAGLLLAGAAPLMTWFYADNLGAEGQKALLWMILATALWIPVASTYSIQYVKLKIDLRFKTIAWIGFGSCVVRYGGQVALALMGYGAMSFVLPLLAVAVWEGVMGYALTSERPWRNRPDVRSWPRLLGDVRWILLGNLMMGGLGQSYYLVIGRLVPLEVIGVFFFGLQLLLQVESVIGFNMQQVLPTIFTRFRNDRERLGGAALRTMRATSMITVPASLGLAVVFPAGQELVKMWEGKWAVAVWPLVILSVGYPLRMLFVGVASVLAQSQGLWARWAWMWSVNSLGVTAVAGAAGAVWKTPEAIAWAVSGFMFATGLWSSVVEMRRLGVGAGSVLTACLAALVIGVVIASACLWLEFGPLAGQNALVRLLVVGGAFGAAYTVAVRVLLPWHLSEGLAIAPASVSSRAAKALRLPAP